MLLPRRKLPLGCIDVIPPTTTAPAVRLTYVEIADFKTELITIRTHKRERATDGNKGMAVSV
jgi:hypothetical protein